LIHRHIVTEDGETFAAELDGDAVLYATPVDAVEAYLLDQQVEEAKLAYDSEQELLCIALARMLLTGAAVTIGQYFEVLA
jgi:hypothetical protein